MAVAFSDQGVTATGSRVASIDITGINTAVGSDEFLMVHCAYIRKNASNDVSSVQWVDDIGATHDEALTEILTVNNGTAISTSMWGLVNPAADTVNSVARVNFNTSDATDKGVVANAIVWTGVHQTTPTESTASSTGTGTGPSVSVTTTQSDSMVVDSLGNDGFNVTPGAGQTERWDTVQADGAAGAASNETGTGSAVTMSQTISSSTVFAYGAYNIKAAVAASPGPRGRRMLLGAGQ